MKIRSVKFNFIMNFILTASSILFPLITAPYILRVLQAEGNGRVDFASSVMTCFMMFASLGIPTYGIRTCAKVRDDKEELSNTVQELMIINTVTMALTYIAFLVLVFLVPQFAEEKTLLFINSISMVLNVIGVTWFYNAIEQYAYITACSIAFKLASILLMFLLVRSPEDYVKYGAITVFAASGSYILNFWNLRKHIRFKKTRPYRFRVHLRPILVFFSMSAAINVYTNLDTTMLGIMKDKAEVGYYSAGIKIKNLLVSLTTSLGAVLLPRLSYYIEKGEQKAFQETVSKAFHFVLILGSAVTVYFIVMAQEALLLLGGDGYSASVTPMQILMPTVLLIGLSNITGMQILTPYGQENKVLVSIVGGAVLDFVLNLALIPNYGASGAAFATLLAELLVLVVQCYYLRQLLKEIVRYIPFWKYIVAVGAGTVLMLAVKHWIQIPQLFSGTGTLQAFFELAVTAVVFFGGEGIVLILVKEPFVMEMLEKVLGRVFGKRTGGK